MSDPSQVKTDLLIGTKLYPDVQDPEFYDRIVRKKEFYTKRKIPRILDKMSPELAVKTYCGSKTFFIHSHQAFVKNFGSPSTPYDRNALIWGTGTGKTLGSVALSEQFKPIIDSYEMASGIRSFIYVISSDTAKKMFMHELKRPEFKYVTQEEHDRYLRLVQNGETERAEKLDNQFRRRIGQYYKFIAYQSFQHRTIGPTRLIREVDKAKAKETIDVLSRVSLKHSLIIVDEAHNLYNQDTTNEYGNGIMSVVDKEPTCRLLLMTGTPMIYSESEIVDFSNILNRPEARITKNDIMELKDGIWYPKSNYEAVLMKMLRGKISYFRGGHPALFPKRVIVGDDLGGRLKFLRLIRCPMTKNHLAAYRQIISSEKDITFRIEETGLLDIAFPSPKGKNLFIKEEIRSELLAAPDTWKKKVGLSIENVEGRYELKGPFFDRANLEEWSSKCVRMLDEIATRQKGKILIYHDFKNVIGTRMIGEILSRNGFLKEKLYPHEKDPNRTKALEYRTFEILDGDVKQYTEREAILNRFEVNENNTTEGRFLRILVAGRILRESADLKAISQIIIMDGPYSTSESMQIMGRGSRQCSHVMLESAKRVVEVKILVSSVPGKKELSKEEMQYINAEKNFLGIKRGIRLIKSIATDCSLFYADNVRPVEVKENRGCEKKQTCPEECDFADCRYICKPQVVQFSEDGIRLKDLRQSTLDLSSFGEGFYREEIGIVKDIVKSLFSSTVFCTKLPDIIGMVKAFDHYAYDSSLIDEKSIVIAVDEMLKEKTMFINMSGEKGHLIYVGDMYFFQPASEPLDLLIEERMSSQKRLSAIMHVSLSSYIKKHYSEFTMKFIVKEDALKKLKEAKSMSAIIKTINNVKEDVQLMMLEDAIIYFFNLNVGGEKDATFGPEYNKIMNYFKFYNMLISAAAAAELHVDYSDVVSYDKIDRDATFYHDITVSRSEPEKTIMIDFRAESVGKKEKHNVIAANRLYVGHLLKEGFVRLYDWKNSEWVQAAEGSSRKKEWKENPVAVGLLHRSKQGNIVFKIRPPLDGKVKSTDGRRIRKGFVCTSKQKKDLMGIADKFGLKVNEESPVINICDTIEAELIKREIEERKKKSEIKYYYHFLDFA